MDQLKKAVLMKQKLYEKFVPNVSYKNKKESEFQISIK